MKKTMLGLAFLYACSSAPPTRVTTDVERSQALLAIAVVETAVVAAHAAGRIDTDSMAKATAQILELRAFVNESANTPVDVTTLLLRITNLGVAWIPPAR